MRRSVLAAALVLAACPRHEVAPQLRPGPPPVDAPVRRPGLRLPEGVTPLAYDLTLELDPDREAFTGHVEIRVRLDEPRDTIWLHAVDLEIASAIVRVDQTAQPLGSLPATTDPMRGFTLPHAIGPGELVLAFDYTGHTSADQQGAFRQQTGGRWYLFTQSESVFARRILPCFDEPRFKPAWRVTLIVPRDLVALGNAAVADDTVLADQRHRVRFAEIDALPSYLLAFAVGPFELVDAGRIGRRQIPLRVAVARGDREHAAVARRQTGKLVEALERYLDAPLPEAKLDLVAVPHFFGAMENTGLVTFEVENLVGDAEPAWFGHRFIRIAAHELAHQWLGNAVTPAWWDDLWLSEAFANWLGDRVTAEVGGFDDPVLRLQLARQSALAADADVEAQPLHRAVTSGDDAEAAFDAISYEKGAAVLATFEQWLGPTAFRDVVRDYVRAHAGGVTVPADLLAELVVASSPAVASAFFAYVDRVGVPIVELAVVCDGAPRLRATVRGAGAAPICVRYPGTHGETRTCLLAGGRADHALDATACPAWLVGNAEGIGYYHVVSATALPPLAKLATGERLARGDDLAAEVTRGERSLAAGLAALRELAATRDPYLQLAAIAIARAIEPLVDDATQPAWQAWLAARFPDRLSASAVFAPSTAALGVLRDDLVELVPADHLDRGLGRRAQAALAKGILVAARADTADDADLLIRVAAPAGGSTLFDQVVAAVLAADSEELRASLAEDLGAFGPALAPRLVEVVLDGRLPTQLTWPAVTAMLERSETRTAIWAALRARLPEVLAQLTAPQSHELVVALASLCTSDARAAVAAEFTPRLAAIVDGRRALDHSLAAIDRCVARRARAGDLSLAFTGRP